MVKFVERGLNDVGESTYDEDVGENECGMLRLERLTRGRCNWRVFGGVMWKPADDEQR